MSARRRSLLTLLSFLLPLGLWCVVSYVPWIWHPVVRMEIAAERAVDGSGQASSFNAGDRVPKEYFHEFAQAIRDENTAAASAVESEETASMVRRSNKRALRMIVPAARQAGILNRDQDEDDAAIHNAWLVMAAHPALLAKSGLNAENAAIVHEVAKKLESLELGDNGLRRLPGVPLQKLVPQGSPSNPDFFPAPHEVIQSGYDDWTAAPQKGQPTMFQRLLKSLSLILGGFALACMVALPLGILCGVSRTLSRLIEPFVDFFRYMPAPVFSTLLLAIFMAGDAPKLGLVFIGTVFSMLLVIANTTRTLDPSLLEAAQTLGARRPHLLFRVVIPGVMPSIYHDLRLLIGAAWTWLVIAELIGVKSGLTEFIEVQGRYRQFSRVFAVIITIGIVGFLTDQFLQWMHAWFFPWTHEKRVLPAWMQRVHAWITSDHPKDDDIPAPARQP